jgi:argonaute-like protein implicated in RNA metabolism and viral defense
MELHVVKDAHGSTHDSYPFLLDSNEKDKALIRNLLVYRPFLQKKGEQTTAWTNIVEMMFDTKTADRKKVFEKKCRMALPSGQQRNVSSSTSSL